MRLHQILRRLAKTPTFTAVAVFTLAIGIGANTAIFSVVDGVLLKPLPYPRPGELVTLDHAALGVNLPHAGVAPFLYFTYREDGRSFQDVGIWTSGTMSVTGLAQPEEVRSLHVTDGVLPILGVRPMAGRVFSRTDDSPDSPETVMLTAGYWRSKFGGDQSAVGRTIAINGTVLAFTLVLSLVAGLLFGIIPVFKYAGVQLNAALRGGGRTVSASKERHRARNTLVVAQVALALVLLVSSGLMIRTFGALKNVHPGFTRPDEVQMLRLSIPSSQVKEPIAVAHMHQAIMDKIAAVPGVVSVALTSIVPMTGQGWHDPLYAQDKVYAESKIPPIIEFKIVTPGYIKTMGASLVAGRDFEWADAMEQRLVAMVSEGLARELWGEPSAAIGKRVRPYATGDWREVVGVVSNERDDGVNKKAPSIAFWPILTKDFSDGTPRAQRSMSYVIRSGRTGSNGFIGEVSQAIWSVNPNLPLASVRTLREVYDASLARTSFTLVMLAIAGGMALLLGVAGIYGVISYSVTQRTREIGIRVALGARAQEVTRMFVGHGLVLATIGAGIGLAAAFSLMRLMSSLLFEVSAADPLTYGAVTLALVASTVLASYVPALRATSVDPAVALRSE